MLRWKMKRKGISGKSSASTNRLLNADTDDLNLLIKVCKKRFVVRLLHARL